MKAFIQKYFIYTSPFLVAIYTVLFLYTANINIFRINVLPLPLFIVIFFAAVIFGVVKLIFRRLELAAPISSIIIFAALSYQRILDLADLSIHLGGISVDEAIIVPITLVAICAFLIYLLLKKVKDFTKFNKILTYIVGVLVLLSIFQIGYYEIKSGRLGTSEQKLKPLAVKPVKFDGDKPDIYYIILDRYAGSRSLKEQYNFDNEPFLNLLRSKGFYVPENSTTNYPKTSPSLTSSLNMSYNDYLTKLTNGGTSGDESITTPLIQNNKVIQFLKDRGYRVYNMGSWWAETATNPNAVKNFTLHYGVYPFADEFTTGFLNTTITAPILKATFHDNTAVSTNPQNNLHRKMADYEFSEIPKIAKERGPKFVFIHILLPHDPFVFDKNCKPISEDVVNAKTDQHNYLIQVECANKKTTSAVNSILSESKNPPVIILQADEGPYPMNSPLPPKQSWSTADTQSLREKFPILNAYYFPGIKNTKLYNNITPVNSFRVLFNDYFGTNYPLLPDKNYIFKDENNFYLYSDVTDKVKK